MPTGKGEVPSPQPPALRPKDHLPPRGPPAGAAPGFRLLAASGRPCQEAAGLLCLGHQGSGPLLALPAPCSPLPPRVQDRSLSCPRNEHAASLGRGLEPPPRWHSRVAPSACLLHPAGPPVHRNGVGTAGSSLCPFPAPRVVLGTPEVVLVRPSPGERGQASKGHCGEKAEAGQLAGPDTLPTAVRQGRGGPSFLVGTAFGGLKSPMLKTWKSNSLSRSHSKPQGTAGGLVTHSSAPLVTTGQVLPTNT